MTRKLLWLRLITGTCFGLNNARIYSWKLKRKNEKLRVALVSHLINLVRQKASSFVENICSVWKKKQQKNGEEKLEKFACLFKNESGDRI